MHSPTLVAMGGNIRLDGPAFEAFYQLSGGPEGCIAILPTASELADAGSEYVEALKRLGLRNPARVLQVRDRTSAALPEMVNALRSATGIFMTGGNQMRMPVILGGTPVHQEILVAAARGAVIGGTSAGTAALSSVMIASGISGPTPRGHIAHLSPGLGLISSVIFDQHFRQRNRLGRLLYAIACSPALLGVGVDEDTAAIIQGEKMRVVGKNAVTVVDGQHIESSDVSEVDGNGVLAVSGFQLHILTHGCSFDLAVRRAHIARAFQVRG